MMPLKTVRALHHPVDRQTGYIETAAGLKPGPLSQDAAVTQAFLAQYVLARETFDAADLQRELPQGAAAGRRATARDQYLKEMAPTNPPEPAEALSGDDGGADHHQERLAADPDQRPGPVRRRAPRRRGSIGGTVRPYSAVVAFRYTGAPMRMEDRFVNPLGFQVTRYRRDAETAGSLAAPMSGTTEP